MKPGFLFCLFTIIIISTVADAQTVNSNKAYISWNTTIYDFGKIKHKIPDTAIFEFKNESLIPVIINNVKPSCGCTAADYPKAPIKPFKSGKISAIYDAKKVGVFSKSVKVFLNTEAGYEELILKGEVVSD